MLTPFPARGCEGADEAGDDHDPVDEDYPDHGRPGETGGEHEVGEEEGRGDEPRFEEDRAEVSDGTSPSDAHVEKLASKGKDTYQSMYLA